VDSTRGSLILRIRDPRDQVAWREFESLYGPLLYRYARARGLSREDAEDLRSQCLAVVVEKIARFDYDKARGGFKNWLRRIAHNRIVDTFRRRREKQADSMVFKAVQDEEPGPDKVWDAQWRRQHLQYCLEQVRGEVSDAQYRAFRLLVFEERSVQDVCAACEMNANQVYKAKSRILQRVREKLAELGLSEE